MFHVKHFLRLLVRRATGIGFLNARQKRLCAVGGGSVIGFIAAIRGGRIYVQRGFNGGGSSRYAAGRNAEAVSAAPRREGVGNCSIIGNKRRWVFIAGVGKCGGRPLVSPS